MSTAEHYAAVIEELYDEAAKVKGVERISTTDWAALEDCLYGSKRRDEYAAALRDWWANYKDEAGFNQPAGSLVGLVTEITGSDPFGEVED